MIDYIPKNQLNIFDFKTPFNSSLSPDNRWVRLAQIVPWDKFAEVYLAKMDTDHGRRALPPRMILGALIIKHQEGLSDEKTILAIQENVYMQFFVGLPEFQREKIFDPSLFVTIRRRLDKNAFDQLNVELIQKFTAGSDQKVMAGSKTNSGRLQADATVADQYITYPTDVKLLNTAREKLDQMIDKIYLYCDKSFEKPRTYRRVLRREFLNYSKKKNKKKSVHRKMQRRLLESVKRNLGFVDALMPDPGKIVTGRSYPLTRRDLDMIEVIRTLLGQQKKMYDERTNTCRDRVVSLHQSHVRPIVRGKQGSRVEFGSKIGVSLDHGFARVDTLSWDAYHEGTDLKKHVTNYHEIHGYYPELVQVDKAYATRENRNWLKERNIGITATKLGRRPKEQPTYYEKRKRRRQAAERNHIEGKFGQGKNAYGLNKIRARLKETSESWVSCIFFVMNLINYRKKASSVALSYRFLLKSSIIFDLLKTVEKIYTGSKNFSHKNIGIG